MLGAVAVFALLLIAWGTLHNNRAVLGPHGVSQTQGVSALNGAHAYSGLTNPTPSAAETSYFRGLGEVHVPPADVLGQLPPVDIAYDDPALSHSAQAAVADSVLRQQFLAEFFSYYPSMPGLETVATVGAIGQYQISFVEKNQAYNLAGGCLWPVRAAVVAVPESVIRTNDPQGSGYGVVLFWKPTAKLCTIQVVGHIASVYSGQPTQQLILPAATTETKALGQYVGGPVLQEYFTYGCGSSPTGRLESLCQVAGAS